jgi:TonB family protein
MTNHSFDPETIMAFVDGELPPDRARDVRLHLEQCSHCRRLVENLHDTSASLSKWTIPATPRDAKADQDLFSAVDKFHRRTSMPLYSFFRVSKPRFVIAACSLILAFAVWAQLSASRVSLAQEDMKAKLVKASSPNPKYPDEAKKKNIQGIVKLHALVSRDGSIKKLSVISGDPLLAKAASDAVWHWKYQPTLVNGKPVEVDTTVEINFTLLD